MVQPRPLLAWGLLGLLTGLLGLCLSLPVSLDGVFQHQKSLGAVPSKQSELPKGVAVVRASAVEKKANHCPSGGVTGIPWPQAKVCAISTVDAGQGGSVVACAHNDDAGQAGEADPPHYPRNEAVFLPSPENPRSVVTEGQFRPQVAETPSQQQGVAVGNAPTGTPPQAVLRLPTVVANMPAPIREAPGGGRPTSASNRSRLGTSRPYRFGSLNRSRSGPIAASKTRGRSRKRCCWR